MFLVLQTYQYYVQCLDNGHLLYFFICRFQIGMNSIDDDDVMVNWFVPSAVDCGFEPRSGQIKDYKIGICCFSAKYAALRRKSKYWMARNRDNVADMTICGLLFQ